MSTELPTSPALFANVVRDHVPPSFSVVAIGGNRTQTRVEVIDDGGTLVIRKDGTDWACEMADGSTRVITTAQGLIALLQAAFPGTLT